MGMRLSVVWILSSSFPIAVGDTKAYPIMILIWSLTGAIRNIQRAWRETHLVGGWESLSLSVYIGYTLARYFPCLEAHDSSV